MLKKKRVKSSLVTLLLLSMVWNTVFPAFAEQSEGIISAAKKDDCTEMFVTEQAIDIGNTSVIFPMEVEEILAEELEDLPVHEDTAGIQEDWKIEVETPLEAGLLNAATSRTQEEAVRWIQERENEGWARNYDGAGGNNPQCVDLICYYLDWLGLGGLKGGNGNKYANKDVGAYGCSYQSSPLPGDIAVWDINKGMARSNGHVALVKAIGNGNFYYVDVNGATGLSGKGWISNSNPSKFIRPGFSENKGYIDLNGLLNGAEHGGIEPCGTADVYINGALAANDVTDFYQQFENGTRYEIKDIKASTGYVYNGLASGSDTLSGTVASGVTRNVRLSFSTAKYSITWKDYNGTTLKTDTVTHGATPAYSGTPVRKADDSYYYEFIGWDPVVVPATKNATYTAKYNAIPIKPVDMTGWTLYEKLPANAQVTEEAWTYRTTKTETKTSSAETMDGWVKTKSSWKKTGSGTSNYADFPGGFDTGHSLYGQYNKSKLTATETKTNKREVNTALKSYIYWHWTTSKGWLKNDNYNVYINDYSGVVNGRNYQYFMAHELTDDLGHTDRRGTTLQDPYYWWVDNPDDGSWWWYRFNVYTQTYTDYVKENEFTRTIVGYYKSDTKVTASSTITDVKHWVKYKTTSSGGSSSGGGGSSSGGGGSSSGGGGSSSGGGGLSSGGGGGAAGSPNAKKTAASGAATFSRNWFSDAAGVWRIKDRSGNIVTSAWLCDDAVTANGQSVWYLMNTDGSMLAAGLVQDNTGNYYSLEMNHNGYFGMLRYVNGVYDGIYMEFSQKHDGTFGAITNQSAIDALKSKYGVTKFGIGNDRCVYTKSFE